MIDIVQRLRDRAYAGKGVDALCEEAAAEIERLRREPCPHVVGTATRYCSLTPFTLTDAEREAVADVLPLYAGVVDDKQCQWISATLRGLLARLA